ncbi:MAG: ATP-dependent DNA helicase RecG [Bacteroidetes bacterium]|nr:ATP-dependent DNA helicase RecG [Bacteroidota bacterium]
MSTGFFETPIEFLKGVGPQRSELLKKELGIRTFGDLLNHFPFRYVDRTKFYKVNEVNADLPYIQLKGILKNVLVKGEKYKKMMVGKLVDETGSVDLVWFQGVKWIAPTLKLNAEYIVFGKPGIFNRTINIVHPEMELASEAALSTASAMQAVYSSTEKLKSRFLDSRGLLRLEKNLQQQLTFRIRETLPQEIINELKMMSRHDALVNIHFPESVQKQKLAEFRLKFEELFFIQLRLLIQKVIRTEKYKGIPFLTIGENFNRFYKENLPYTLTEAQKRVLREIRTDCGSGKQMNRLLQGDVGSGKTIVALLSMLMAIDNGYQACIMAPTEILANQHAETISSLLNGLDIPVTILTGSTKTKQRKIIFEQLANGTIKILIGTHALIEETVQFQKLGLVVIDEQHRFGVEQRARLHTKGETSAPHILVMTATPIPRTLAMTLYGDLDVSVIDEMPPGRKEIKTVHRYDSHRMQVWGFLKKEIELSRQVYIVYPLIEESAKMDLKNLMDGYESICRDFPRPRYQASIVHGKMKAKDKDYEMQRFKNKETNIMVATSVIEVGVNIPNASVMVIENAERFGLSQLHQLRGRVGRGADQSYCILMSSDKPGHDARQRLKTMVETNDGFKIAEMDLQLRGAGDLQGTQQSGIPGLKIADLTKDGQVLQAARNIALKILKEDPHLGLAKNSTLKNYLSDHQKKQGDWSRVS